MSFLPLGGRCARPVLRAGVTGALVLATLLPGLPRVPLAAAQTFPSSVQIAISDAISDEGKDMEFTITVTNNPGIYIDYTTTAVTATDGVDFVGGSTRIFLGQTSNKLSFRTLQDNLLEEDETFTVLLSGQSFGDVTRRGGQGTIRNEDPKPTLIVNDITVTEGDSGFVNAVFDVTMSNPSIYPVWLDFVTQFDMAIGGPNPTGDPDYENSSGRLTWPLQTNFPQIIVVRVRGDLVHEGDEDFHLVLTPSPTATVSAPFATATILDNDPEPGLVLTNVGVAEGDSGTRTISLPVSLTGLSSSAITARYRTDDGTATSPDDYASASGTLTIPAGATSTTILLTVNGDKLNEPNEDFSVVFYDARNATLSDHVTHIAIINDDLFKK